MLPDSKLGYRKKICTFDILLTLIHHVQTSLETKFVTLDFSSAFHVVNHKALLSKVSRHIWLILMLYQVSYLTGVNALPVMDVIVTLLILSLVLLRAVFSILIMWYGISSNLMDYADDASLYYPIPDVTHLNADLKNCFHRGVNPGVGK